MTTIRDVAKLAGVGVATASRVMSRKGPYSAEAAARVDDAVEKLSFRPSTIARALSLQSTGTIGVYVPEFSGSFYGPMLHAIDFELRQYGLHMVAANGYGREDPRQQALNGAQFLIDRQCDGVILTSNALKDADYLELKRKHPRLAVVNREVKGIKTHCFSVEHREAGRLAAQALLSHGHRQIAVISGLENAPDNHQRLQGFLDELAKVGIVRDDVIIVNADFTSQSGWTATEVLLAQDKPFTGLFCCNDQMAMGAMSCLQAAGRSIPQDVSVIGYDDADVAAFLSPRLSSVRIAIGSMGQNACRLMLNLCYDKTLSISYDFPPELVIRDSLGPVHS